MREALDSDWLADEIASRIAGLADCSTPKVRSVRREYSRLLFKAEPDAVMGVALRLVRGPHFACRWVAYELIANHKAANASMTAEQLMKLAAGIDSWGAVDGFGCILSGPAWRDGRVADTVVRGWAGSADRWFRRAALVSTIALSRRGGPEDVAKTVDICSRLVEDRDEMVVKALSWALRELAKKHDHEARAFLEVHRTQLAARVIREVGSKLATGLKNPRRA